MRTGCNWYDSIMFNPRIGCLFEVDDNVTRHLSSELSKEDWRIMVLHYLGLDHIGHVEGPHSLLVRPKLQEMDHIVKRIHHRFIAWVRRNKLNFWMCFVLVSRDGTLPAPTIFFVPS